MAIRKIISNILDWLVKDNFGFHVGLSFMIFIYISNWSVVGAMVITSCAIIGKEVFDKKILKTNFSGKDIVAGIIGMILAYVSLIII